jgi:hypothetical protein
MMGNWDNAFIKSIMYVGLGSIAYLLLMAFIDGYEAHEFIMLLTLYGTGYVLVSFVGWIAFGLPIHYLISKYTNSSYFYYVLSVVLLLLILWAIVNSETALFFGLFALIQALIFRYLVFKKT